MVNKQAQSLYNLIFNCRYSIREQVLDDGFMSELGIAQAYRLDTGVLTCLASNAYGQDEMTIQLIVQGKIIRRA